MVLSLQGFRDLVSVSRDLEPSFAGIQSDSSSPRVTQNASSTGYFGSTLEIAWRMGSHFSRRVFSRMGSLDQNLPEGKISPQHGLYVNSQEPSISEDREKTKGGDKMTETHPDLKSREFLEPQTHRLQSLPFQVHLA